MNTGRLSYDIELRATFGETVERVMVALKAEGFGVLTRADLHTAFEEKLGQTFRPYVILGACNPPLAHRALSARPEAGLFLPCNVVIEEASPGNCVVRIVNPREMMKSGGFETDTVLASVGAEADAQLQRVAEALE